MGIVFPMRFQELTEKMQVALATNRDWFLDYIKQNAKPGEPLPYDERIGLTKGEYAEYLALGEKKEMRKLGSAEVHVTNNAGIFQFRSGGTIPDLDEVTIKMKDLTVATPFGEITNLAPDSSESGGVIGPYSGYRWTFETGDQELNNIKTASFLIGYAKNTGRNFIYYKGGIVRSKNPVKNTLVLILYDRPKP